MKKGLLQSEELYKYVLETSVFPREPEVLKELREVTAAHPGFDELFVLQGHNGYCTRCWSVNNDAFAARKCKKDFEVGVYTGYSLLLTALSIPHDGKITAIDPNRETYEIGLPVIRKAGVEHKIDYKESEALPVLDKLLEDRANEGSFDFAFVDADKVNFWNYHERLMKLLKVGGLVVYDNTLWTGSVALDEESTLEFLREGRKFTLEFNKLIAADPRIQISHAPLGDGITICRRLK